MCLSLPHSKTKKEMCFALYTDLTPVEKTKAVAPSDVYPVLGVGSTPGSPELVLITRMYQTKKEVHRIPHNSQTFSIFSLWFPMFAGPLPDTSVFTMRRSVPHIKVGTWQHWSVWIRKEFLSWQETNVSHAEPECQARRDAACATGNGDGVGDRHWVGDRRWAGAAP